MNQKREFTTFKRNSFAGMENAPEDSEFVIFGVPYDLRSAGRRSILEAPQAIRRASMDLESISNRFLVDYDFLKISDIGDITGFNFDFVKKEIYNTVKGIEELHSIPVMLGGEHTVTWPAVKCLEPDLLIILDAHLDMRDEYMGEKECNATFVRRLVEEVENLNVMHIGSRAYSREEITYLEDKEYNIIPLKNSQLGKTKDEIRKIIQNFESIYVSIDLDVLDPAFMSEVGNPEPEGMTPTQLFELFHIFRDLTIKGLDIVELSPTLHSHPSHHVAAKTVYEFLSSITRDENVKVETKIDFLK